jgi:hypothetical protein
MEPLVQLVYKGHRVTQVTQEPLVHKVYLVNMLEWVPLAPQVLLDRQGKDY